ncbi:MAG: ribonuclease H-like domain-containing protein, partial [bacterium]
NLRPWRVKVFMLAGKDENLKDFNYKKALFVDTETTGLAGGTGTVPFLIGIGYFKDNQFVIEQYMMRDYDEEAALLQALEPRFSESEFIVSYNGKSYDVNILTTRLILNRMNNYLHDLHHFDLLYTVRRIWGARLQDCSLLNVERCIFDFYREDDIPGYLIPSLYFDYISSGNGSKMVQVFQHNRLDILTLAVLAGHTARIYLNPVECLDHSLDLASIARSFENLDEFGKASLCYKKALEQELLHSDREEVLYRLGYLFKRTRYWSKANKIWGYIIQHYASSFTAYEELAKYYEHKAKDFKKASAVVHKALKRMEIQEELAGGGEQEKIRLAFEYRLKRLQRKELQKVGN